GDGNIGIGFAIPVNMARHVMEDLRTKGKVTRSQLGVSVQQVTPDMAASLGLKEASGVIVSGVTAGSAAEHAGLKQGDVIKSFNGQAVKSVEDLRSAIKRPSDRPALLLINRNGSEIFVTVRPSNG